MHKRFYISLFLFILPQIMCAQAQDASGTPYFPYQTGDTLVYSISGLVERPDDSKIIFTGDSVADNGDRFFFVESEGYFPIASSFKVDTVGNIYAADWWDRPDYWQVFNASKEINKPWVVYEGYPGLEGDLVLGKITEETTDQGFGIESAVKAVHIYNAGDTTDTIGYDFNITRWKADLGITRKFNFEGGPTHNLKGAVIDGQVYGDTTMYRVPPPSTVQKDYFPYQIGDVVVYSVTDSMGNSLPDSRIEFVSDSVDAEGNTWYALKAEGYQPVVDQFMVDTAKNIYATGWWGDNEEPWKVFDAYFGSEPWVVQNNGGFYELGDIWVSHSSYWLFNEQQFWYNDIGLVVYVRYYEAENNSALASDTNIKVQARWNANFGIISKDDSLSKINYEIKGAFINGELRGDTAAVITSSEPEPTIPSGITLRQNYPNPFNPSTTIAFEVNQPTEVNVTIYSVTGQMVQRLIQDQKYPAGVHRIAFDAGKLKAIASGIYLYELTTPSHRVVKKMTLIK